MGYSNYDVAHAWAHNEDRAHNGSNMSHEDGVLKSYYTCIGQRIELKDKTIYIVDSARYSSSTSKHQNYMRGAIPDKCDDVSVFAIDRYDKGRSYFLSPLTMKSFDKSKSDFIVFGLEYLIEEFSNCLEVPNITQLDYKFSYQGYKEMVRWFETTGCMTVNKILKMKVTEFNSLAKRAIYDLSYGYQIGNTELKKLRKFFKLMTEDTPVSIIVDLINGSGSWKQYLDRTARLRKAQKCRRLSQFVGYLTPSTAWCKRILGKYVPTVSGSITAHELSKYAKNGCVGKWLLSIKKENYAAAIQKSEINDMLQRKRDAKTRLEKHLGLCGFNATAWCPKNNRMTKFDYNGTVINFLIHERTAYRERPLDDDEYKEFVKMSDKDKKKWMFDKKQWMCQQLQSDLEEYRNRMALIDKEKDLAKQQAELYRKQELEQQDYINELKKRGDEGMRQLYHEGFRVNLPFGNQPIYFGGNVLLRFNKIRNLVETSKGIRIALEECQRLWKYINRWHQNSTQFENKGMKIQSIGSMYTVHSYQNDILTVGCHQIAYQEMKLIAEQLHLG